MSVSWNNDLELALLECYQAEPVIWQSKHKDHKNKSKVHDAWIRISTVMNMPVADLKKKKESLMSSYRAYRKKVNDSIHSGAGSGEIYKPIWFAYETMDSFHGEGGQCNETIVTENEVDDTSSPNTDSQDTKSSIVNNSQQQLTIRRRKNPSELTLAEETVKDALSTLKTTLKTRELKEDDECDLHGKIIAKKLRKLSEDERENVICDIYQMFQRRAQLNRPQTPIDFYVSSPSPSTQPFPTYQRLHRSSTAYSEPLTHQQRAHSSRSSSTYSEPVIHIPEETSTAGSRIFITRKEVAQPAFQETVTAGSRILITSNEVVQPASHETSTASSNILITSNEVVQPATEDPADYENMIDKAYNYA